MLASKHFRSLPIASFTYGQKTPHRRRNSKFHDLAVLLCSLLRCLFLPQAPDGSASCQTFQRHNPLMCCCALHCAACSMA
jgi:hypothetical protein